MVTGSSHNCAYIVINTWAKRTPQTLFLYVSPSEKPPAPSNAISTANIKPPSATLSPIPTSPPKPSTSDTTSSVKPTSKSSYNRQPNRWILNSCERRSKKRKDCLLSLKKNCNFPKNPTKTVWEYSKQVRLDRSIGICYPAKIHRRKL